MKANHKHLLVKHSLGKYKLKKKEGYILIEPYCIIYLYIYFLKMIGQ